jgi:hypothetical protein
MAAMRSCVPCLLVAAASACSKPSASQQEAQNEPYAHAVAALDADHPRTLPDFALAMGRPPAGCALKDATCECTWRFVTKDGAREIVADASFADARTAEPETLPLITRGNSPVELPPDEAERGYRAGAYNAPPHERLPVSTAGGGIVTIASEDLTEFLNGGGHLVSRRALKAAELERTYASWTARQRLQACTSQPDPVFRVERDGQAVAW